MRKNHIDVSYILGQCIGENVWRARVGVGSFLTFDLGRRIKRDIGDIHFRGAWHLWIYHASWSLHHAQKEVVNSDSDRKFIKLAIRRLENQPLTKAVFDKSSLDTTFSFGHFHLLVSAPAYLNESDDRDHYWVLFMPDNQVLAVGPKTITLKREVDRSPSLASD